MVTEVQLELHTLHQSRSYRILHEIVSRVLRYDFLFIPRDFTLVQVWQKFALNILGHLHENSDRLFSFIDIKRDGARLSLLALVPPHP